MSMRKGRAKRRRSRRERTRWYVWPTWIWRQVVLAQVVTLGKPRRLHRYGQSDRARVPSIRVRGYPFALWCDRMFRTRLEAERFGAAELLAGRPRGWD
jgi:hypothetical protein